MKEKLFLETSSKSNRIPKQPLKNYRNFSAKMSKSKVKDPKANPNGPRPATTSVRAVLQRGEQINKTRCRTSPASIDVPCRSSKQNPKFKDVTVCKILWPHETKYPACSHGNDLILNRFAMSQKTHCSLLALPKKVNEIRLSFPNLRSNSVSDNISTSSAMDREKDLSYLDES